MPEQRILVIDDEPVIGVSCQRILAGKQYEVESLTDPHAGLQAALSGNFDVILLDLVMPGLEGMEILRQIKNAAVPAEVIVLTGYATVESAVDAMKLGAADYVSKPFTPEQLRLIVDKVCQRSALLKEVASLRQQLQLSEGLEGILGESRAMQRVFASIKRAARCDAPVLIIGEPGTGKDMVARAIHRLSRRKDRPFLQCDCKSLPGPLLESELFGQQKQIAPGFRLLKQGLFEQAQGGTVYLDEIARLEPQVQGRLFAFLESNQGQPRFWQSNQGQPRFWQSDQGQPQRQPNGANTAQQTDVRLVAATARNLEKMVQKGVFREDLYHCLSAIQIVVPPLRQRLGDIPKLAVAFLEQVRSAHQLPVRCFAPEVMAQLESYHWPGNVRQLRSVVERMALLCDGEQIQLQHVPAEVRQVSAQPSAGELPRSWVEFKRLKRQVKEATVNQLERRFLIEVLRKWEGNVSRAADAIGIQRTNLHALLRKHGLTAQLLRGEQ